MRVITLKSYLAMTASAAMLATMTATPSFAQSGASEQDEIITTGTRRQARSAADTPAPVDVISGVEFQNQASGDLQDLLRTSVPSYNVNSQPISDAATIIRPANLRGLSPDNTLVLMNGKRRHRGSVIAFLGGGIADGAQGADISVFPALALKQVEVLRDGASSQYGSDAIAGVMNFQLKDSAEGGMIEAVYGQTYEGDGTNYRIAGNIGLPLGDKGFVNITAEYGENDGTVRAAHRSDISSIATAGNLAVLNNQTINSYTDAFAQYWGQPDITGNTKLFINSALEISENAEVYAFGNYAERTVEGGFFYRNPTNRGGVYAGPQVNPANGNNLLVDSDGKIVLDANGLATDARTGQTGITPSESIRVGNLAGVDANACPAGIPLTANNGVVSNATVNSQVFADPNCFAFTETIPGGFVPRFGGDNEDFAATAGLRGELQIGNGLGYDFSATYGENSTDFFIRNTINASLGPNTPRDFMPGGYTQAETILNADFNYAVPFGGFASDVNIAFGGEFREETFSIRAGDAASFALGPLAQVTSAFPTGQGFSSSSNGFGGFSTSSSNSQSSYGVYTELEADVTDQLTLQGALRYEDYTAFGDTLNYKIAGLYKLTDNIRLRGAYSTGFHAPTAGQANVTNVTTQQIDGVLVDKGTIPFATAPGQLAASFVEARDGTRPTLSTETAKNIAAGVGFDTGPISWTVDFFNIKVKDRIALSEDIDFIDALNFAASQAGNPAGYDNSSVSSAIASLGNANVIDRAAYTGFEDLTQFRYFTNSFDTKTQGVDVVANAPIDFGQPGYTKLSLAANYTDTTVTNRGAINPIGDARTQKLEELLPEIKGNATIIHEQGIFRGLLRANYYGSWTNVDTSTEVSAEVLFDAEIAAKVYEGVELIVGAANILNGYPDENPNPAGTSGQLYPEASPIGFSGGQYYVKARYTF